MHRSRLWRAALLLTGLIVTDATAQPWYTTRGPDVIDRRTGERTILRGFGLGGWLLPEGYMWGLREVDRPRQFEAKIIDLIGEEDAKEFWRLYHENYVTERDIEIMKAWGVNSVRVPLLASELQPRDGQPDEPPFVYDESGFVYLDRVVDWCEKHEMGLIWDLHGAPGGQNAENISDSDGQARLWTEPEIYWPRTFELWMTIVNRYLDRDCVIGYDLLNEPLLRRYDGIDPALLREFYVTLTREIRGVDPDRLIFIEGDDWAQEFGPLEPIDWDPHLVLGFHSYPPTATSEGLARWDRLRETYNVPLWHGETGEQGPPFAVNTLSTSFLESANVGWSWWTHKKFSRTTQPWLIERTPGFNAILDYWRGRGPRPSLEDALAALFEQARLINSDRCVLIPEMVASLAGLDASAHTPETAAPRVVEPPRDVEAREGDAAEFVAIASGNGLRYAWHRNGEPMPGENTYRLKLNRLSPADDGSTFSLDITNDKGTVRTEPVTLRVRGFDGPEAPRASTPPDLAASARGETSAWDHAATLTLGHLAFHRGVEDTDPKPTCRVLWDDAALFLLVEVTDRVRHTASPSGYDNDGVEIFLDANNSRDDLYTRGAAMLRCVVDAPGADGLFGVDSKSVRVAQHRTADGYRVAIALPWSAIDGGITPGEGDLVGLDVHVNDNDGGTRLFKHAWHAQRDDAHLSPSRLGIVRLAGRND